MLAIDTSGSMSATDVTPSRLAAAEAAARRFVDKLPAGLKVGLALVRQRSPRARGARRPITQAVLSALDNLDMNGGTATGDAIYQSLAAIASQPRGADGKKAGAAIVLMSDGAPTIGRPGQSPRADRCRSHRRREEGRRADRLDRVRNGERNHPGPG